jgi:exodeoxyribonuclease VII large subunit
LVDERALTVTEAMGAAKRALEGVRVRVLGEVSEFNDKPGYKAAYFTVSDGGAAMPCLMWRDVYEASGVELRCGMLVELSGQFSAYVPKGRMQFQVRALAPAGEGNMRLQVATLARKLESEGLMRSERKRSLPRFPERIALVTSPRGKAVHDVIRTLRRRYPLAELLIAGVAVEGEGAPSAIVAGLEKASSSGADVILLVRGGGSYEDLMPFNAEQVARAVVACPIPVVTGIGHEPDTSIADMVADFRASTPTAAAEAASPSHEQLVLTVVRERRALATALQNRVKSAAQHVGRLAERPVLRDPYAVLGPVAQAVDMAGMRLARAIPERIARDAQRIEYVRGRLARVGPALLDRARTSMAVGAARLEDLSPLGILGRGYAVCFAGDGITVVRSVADLTCGNAVHVRVGDGRIDAQVTELIPLED